MPLSFDNQNGDHDQYMKVMTKPEDYVRGNVWLNKKTRLEELDSKLQKQITEYVKNLVKRQNDLINNGKNSTKLRPITKESIQKSIKEKFGTVLTELDCNKLRMQAENEKENQKNQKEGNIENDYSISSNSTFYNSLNNSSITEDQNGKIDDLSTFGDKNDDTISFIDNSDIHDIKNLVSEIDGKNENKENNKNNVLSEENKKNEQIEDENKDINNNEQSNKQDDIEQNSASKNSTIKDEDDKLKDEDDKSVLVETTNAKDNTTFKVFVNDKGELQSTRIYPNSGRSDNKYFKEDIKIKTTKLGQTYISYNNEKGGESILCHIDKDKIDGVVQQLSKKYKATTKDDGTIEFKWLNKQEKYEPKINYSKINKIDNNKYNNENLYENNEKSVNNSLSNTNNQKTDVSLSI